MGDNRPVCSSISAKGELRGGGASGLGALAVRYQDAPVLRSLLRLVPLWSAADTLLQQRAEEIKRERLRVFFDELAEKSEGLTVEVAQTDDFIHCFLRTTEAALNTRKGEKVRLLARLLRAATQQGAFSDIDEFEDLLDILASTSDRELAALALLREYEQRKLRGSEDEADALKYILGYWNHFEAVASERLSIRPEEFQAFMARLERTALFTSSLGAMWDTKGAGRTTPLFSRLAALVLADGSPWESPEEGEKKTGDQGQTP